MHICVCVCVCLCARARARVCVLPSEKKLADYMIEGIPALTRVPRLLKTACLVRLTNPHLQDNCLAAIDESTRGLHWLAMKSKADSNFHRVVVKTKFTV